MKVPVPFVREVFDGRVAELSVELNRIKPVKPVALLPAASFAVRLKVNSEPETVVAGTAPMRSWVAAPGLMVSDVELEMGDPEMVAPRVTTPDFTPVKVEL